MIQTILKKQIKDDSDDEDDGDIALENISDDKYDNIVNNEPIYKDHNVNDDDPFFSTIFFGSAGNDILKSWLM